MVWWYEPATLGTFMGFDFFERESVERSQCFGNVGIQNIGTSPGFVTMAVRCPDSPGPQPRRSCGGARPFR